LTTAVVDALLLYASVTVKPTESVP
jgi:hypothetical protein